ncbi:unnamed protein product [Arabidopsis arenosa]|uniref:Uncharacterized protein n=1 Tax=Arabidopsis arenosa TaxID=38785 RepID=A0A8S2AR21_ARAAE|nr:unnamed protein product [Arabidopsis arenosa]
MSDDDIWSEDEEIDPEEAQEYLRQVQESDGFDVDYFHNSYARIKPFQLNDEYGYTHDMELYGRLGLHCYNLHKETNLKLIDIHKYNTELFFGYYITLEAVDTYTNSPCTFQTCLVPTGPRTTCIGPQRRWEDEVIDDFYKSEMPNWLTKEELAAANDKGQYYELQESDLLGNEWLHLYAEFALSLNWRGYAMKNSILRRFLPLKIKKVIVHTRESGEESPHLKLKANNAIFYMSFKGNSDHPSGKPVEYQAIVRKTMDGKPGHIRLEVQSWAGLESQPT